MDEYDLRRLQSFKDRTLRLTAEELQALHAVEPDLSRDDLKWYAEHEDDEVSGEPCQQVPSSR